MTSANIEQESLNCCNVLGDAGMSYGDYVDFCTSMMCIRSNACRQASFMRRV